MNQIKLAVEPRPQTGKGAAGRLRKQGRVPGVVYGYDVEPTAVSVDALELYHALHGPAGRNVLLVIQVDGEDSLCVARDIQRHPVKGDYVHVDLLSVDKNTTISVEVPVSVVGEIEDAGIISQILTTVTIMVPPLKTPNGFEVSVEGLAINDVIRVGDLTHLLPEGATWDIDEDRTIVTINAPAMAEETDDDTDLLEVQVDDEA